MYTYDWMGGPDGKIFSRRYPVRTVQMTKSQILPLPARTNSVNKHFKVGRWWNQRPCYFYINWHRYSIHINMSKRFCRTIKRLSWKGAVFLCFHQPPLFKGALWWKFIMNTNGLKLGQTNNYGHNYLQQLKSTHSDLITWIFPNVLLKARELVNTSHMIN